MNKLFVNPFFCYSFAFLISLSLYDLRWSDIYPELSITTLLFLSSSILISFLLGILFNSLFDKKSVEFNRKFTKFNSYSIVFFIAIGFLLEFIYSKNVPLIWGLLGWQFNYKEFGIPTFHVFLLPYSSAFVILSFYRYICNKNNRYHLVSMLFIMFLISLIVNRAALMVIIFSIILIYCYKRFSRKKVVPILFLITTIIYAFGFIGNKRMISQGYENEYAVLDVAMASSSFKESLIPNEFFWGYLYSTVSIANLENQLYLYADKPLGDSFDILAYDILPDFISKRVVSENKQELFKPDLIKEELTTSTIYGRAIKIDGYIGGAILYLYMCLLVFLSFIFSPREYTIPVCSIFSIICALSIFSNMVVFSGVILQVFLMILLGFRTKQNINFI